MNKFDYNRIQITSNDVDKRFKLGDKLDCYTPTKSNFYPFLSLQYALFGNDSHYSFSDLAITLEEHQNLLSILKEISVTKMCDLISNKHLEQYNLKINNEINRELKAILNHIANTSLQNEALPLVGHFHLFSAKSNKNDICPVIHFFIGQQAVIYLLCYDRHHNIHKTKNTSL